MRKMRKTLSFVLILALVLGSFSMAFATSDNKVVSGVSVVNDGGFFGAIIELKNNQGSDYPMDSGLKITLKNAEFIRTTNAVVTSASLDVVAYNFGVTGAPITIIGTSPAISTASVIARDASVTWINTNDTFLQVEFNNIVASDQRIYLYMPLEAGSDTGNVEVIVEGTGGFSSGTYVVATVAGGATIATVQGSTINKVPLRSLSTTVNSIRIDESTVNSLANGDAFRVTLPNGFAFTNFDVTPTYAGPTTPGGATGRIIDVSLIGLNPNKIDTFFLENLALTADRNAKAGDITVQIRPIGGSDVTATTLVIGKYVDDEIMVYVDLKDGDDVPEFIAGRDERYPGTGSDWYLAEVTIEENVDRALISGKYIDFDLPEGVQVTSGDSIEIKVATATAGTGITTGWTEIGAGAGQVNIGSADADIIDNNCQTFEVALPDGLSGNNRGDKITFRIPLSIEATFEGDIVLAVDGKKAGFEKKEVTIATAIAPLNAEAKITDVRTGIKNQAAAEIVIKETEADFWDENGMITVSLDDVYNIDFSKKGKLEVLAGDGDIDMESFRVIGGVGKVIEFQVDNASLKEPFEIKISGAEVSLDRTVPEGTIEVLVGGTAVVANDGTQYKFDDFVVAADYVKVITPADAYTYREATFVIGSDKYMVLEDGVWVEKTMDTAPYITDNRTLVPMRYIGYALGLTDDDIVWNQDYKTATFFGYNKVCTVTVGSNIMTVNGANVIMDTTAKIKDGRVFVPFRYVANGLGASVSWDEATKTITVKSGTNN